MAAGDRLLDSSGNQILDASGNVQLSDGAGDSCCCATFACDFCPDGPTQPGTVLVKAAGINLDPRCMKPGLQSDKFNSAKFTQDICVPATDPCAWQSRIDDGGLTTGYTDALCTVPSGVMGQIFTEVAIVESFGIIAISCTIIAGVGPIFQAEVELTEPANCFDDQIDIPNELTTFTPLPPTNAQGCGKDGTVSLIFGGC